MVADIPVLCLLGMAKRSCSVVGTAMRFVSLLGLARREVVVSGQALRLIALLGVAKRSVVEDASFLQIERHKIYKRLED